MTSSETGQRHRFVQRVNEIFEHTLDMAKNMELDCGFFTIILIVLELAVLYNNLNSLS